MLLQNKVQVTQTTAPAGEFKSIREAQMKSEMLEIKEHFVHA